MTDYVLLSKTKPGSYLVEKMFFLLMCSSCTVTYRVYDGQVALLAAKVDDQLLLMITLGVYVG